MTQSERLRLANDAGVALTHARKGQKREPLEKLPASWTPQGANSPETSGIVVLERCSATIAAQFPLALDAERLGGGVCDHSESG